MEAIPKRIIIDHHRRAEDAIKETVLQYMEPSSSSTSELVTELVGYFNDRLEFTKGEATALYAGIVVDTKNFAVQTGERTFEAAALLRRSGADPTVVRQLFKDDMETFQIRSRLIAEAQNPEPGLVVTTMKKREGCQIFGYCGSDCRYDGFHQRHLYQRRDRRVCGRFAGRQCPQ